MILVLVIVKQLQHYTKQWKQFVQNRIQEIHRLVPVNCWKHCHSGDNPSRGSGLESLWSKKIWWNGPSWLTGTRDTEVIGNVSEEEIKKCSVERKEDSQVTNLLVNEENIRIGMIVKIQRFSLLSRLYRVMYVLKFMKWLKGGLPSDEEPCQKQKDFGYLIASHH